MATTHQVESLVNSDLKALKKDIVVVATSEVGSDTYTLEEPASSATEAQVSEEDGLAYAQSVVPETKEEISLKILRIVESYGTRCGHHQPPWSGLSGYLSVVAEQIEAGQPIRLVFSGFPFKSPLSTGNVLGDLPDLGEKLALSHLDGLCSNIAAVYEKGAEVQIVCEGLVYNDLLGVSDDIAWAYEHAVCRMADREDFRHLRFVHLPNVLGHEPGIWTKEHALTHAPCIRRELLYRYGGVLPNKTEEEAAALIAGRYVAELASEHGVDESASSEWTLRQRLKAYASALDACFPQSIQLFANGPGALAASPALAISLNPQDDNSEAALPPWSSVIAIETDGRYRTAVANKLRNDDAYELIYAHGAPSHFRAKAAMWDWTADGLDVTFEHLYPTGTMIRPVTHSDGEMPSIRALPMRKIRLLSQVIAPVVLRGFSETTNEEFFLSKGNEFGDILTWTFGQILKVKDSGEVDRNANNVTSNEAMPMHFDGIFKFVDTVDPATGAVKKVMTPPGYQYFTCISTAGKGDGYTLFANSRLFFQQLPSPFSISRIEKATWSMVNDGFWSAKQTGLPLVVRHKETGAPCLRWHQPWTNTKYSKYYIEIENDESAAELVEVINTLLYDYRVCLRFDWEQGDLLISDNVSMLHTRTAFSGNCGREMWRIHLD